MRKILFSIVIYLIAFVNEGYGQSAKTIFNSQGVSISYNYRSNGYISNSSTGTKFTKYIITTTISNTSSKFYDVKSTIDVDGAYAGYNLQNKKDSDFARNNSLDASSINHLFCGQGTNAYPNDGLAHLFVIAPNSKSICEKEFIFPSDGEPRITYTSVNITQIKGDAEESQSTTTTNNVQKTPKWSEWKRINMSDCDFSLDYMVLKEVTYRLNYQLWFHYKVKNTSEKNITFVFNLTKNGKVEFSQPHTLGPGQIAEFMHKMSSDYITGVSVTKVINTKTNKSICDDGKTENDLQEAIAKFNALLNQAPANNGTTAATRDRVQNFLKSPSASEESKLKEVNNGISELERLIGNQKRADGNTSNSTDGSLQELRNKQDELLKKIRQIEPNTKEGPYEGNIGESSALTLQRTQTQVNHLESYYTNLQGKVNSEQEAKEKQRAAEKDAFNTNIQKGDEAMGSKDYTSAMSYYQNAKSSTTDTNDQTLAQNKYNQAFEAKRNADREVRVAETKQRDKKEDIAYTTMATSTAGLMAIIKDGYSSKGFAAKFLLGLGYESSPIISNNASEYSINKSYIEKRNLLTFHTGFIFGILNNRPISIYIKPEASLGMSALVPGVSGGFLSYGSSGVIQLASKKHSKFNLFAEGGWFSYDGTFKYDADAVNNTATDDVREGKMKYTKIRYGGGFMLRWIDNGKETFLRPAFFYDKPSFFTTATKPIASMNLQVNIASEILLDFTYTPKTYIPGELLYPTTLEKKNVNYFGIKIIRQGRLN